MFYAGRNWTDGGTNGNVFLTATVRKYTNLTRSSKGRNGHYHQQVWKTRSFFFGSRDSGYGVAPGRSHNPYNTHNNQSYTGRGRQTTGCPYFKKGGVSTVWDHSTRTEATKGPTRTTSIRQQLPTCGSHPTLSTSVEDHHSRPIHSRGTNFPSRRYHCIQRSNQ